MDIVIFVIERQNDIIIRLWDGGDHGDNNEDIVAAIGNKSYDNILSTIINRMEKINLPIHVTSKLK